MITPRALAVSLALLFFAAHVPYLATTLEDIDSINFALALEDFDPARHQPHPPGYPVFVALGKLSHLVVAREATALAFWGALFGALAAFPLLTLFAAIDRGERAEAAGHRRAFLATALTLCAPLVWFTAARPMSDVAGLAAAVVAQAALARAFVEQRADADRALSSSKGRALRPAKGALVLGAFAAALAIGVRSQTAWLTLPLLALVLLDRTGRGAAAAWLGCTTAFAAGVLLWGVPLVIASGGPSGYLSALTSQVGEDVAGVDMLLTNPTPRRLAAGLADTLLKPWMRLPLAAVVLGAALAGLVATVRRSLRALCLILALAAPYTAFHLVFQETATVRYALPLIPVIAWLAVRGLSAFGARAAVALTALLCGASIASAAPSLREYARAGSPTARALADVRARAARESTLAMHHVFARAAQADGLTGARILPAPPKHEWLEIVKHWRGGGGPVWWLADPRRTDLALVDPASLRLAAEYDWPFDASALVGGVRPDRVVRYEIAAPGWFLAEGWSLTPETAGVARADRRAPGLQPIVGFIRRRAEPSVLLIGGRNLGARGDPSARVDVFIDGRFIERIVAAPDPGFFLRLRTLEAGTLAGSGAHARLEVFAEANEATPRPVTVGIEQFNLQPETSILFGFDTGWHEPEYNPVTGRSWHWTSERATLRIHHGGHDLNLLLSGESPLRYFTGPPTVVVRAGRSVLARESPSTDFAYTIRIPRAALDEAGGTVTVETDRVFAPADRGESGDRRRLGLRIFEVALASARFTSQAQ